MAIGRRLPLALVAVMVALAMVRPAAAQQPQTGIRVQGQGRVTVTPDVAILNVGASLRLETPGAAFDRAERLIAAATAALRDNGVAANDITTSQLNLYPEYRPPTPDNPEPVLLGWRAQHFLSVKIRDFSRLGAAVDAAVRSLEEGAQLQGIFFTLENTDAVVAQARDAAATDARTKAERIASRLGVRLGSPIYVQEFGSPGPSPVPFQPFPTPTARPTAIPAAPPAAFAPVQVSPGEQTISVTLDVLFAIEAAPAS